MTVIMIMMISIIIIIIIVAYEIAPEGSVFRGEREVPEAVGRVVPSGLSRYDGKTGIPCFRGFRQCLRLGIDSALRCQAPFPNTRMIVSHLHLRVIHFKSRKFKSLFADSLLISD